MKRVHLRKGHSDIILGHLKGKNMRNLQPPETEFAKKGLHLFFYFHK